MIFHINGVEHFPSYSTPLWKLQIRISLRTIANFCLENIPISDELLTVIIIIIIIIIKNGWQCKAWRERLTPYQSEDPNPTTPTHRMEEEKGKTAGYEK